MTRSPEDQTGTAADDERGGANEPAEPEQPAEDLEDESDSEDAEASESSRPRPSRPRSAGAPMRKPDSHVAGGGQVYDGL